MLSVSVRSLWWQRLQIVTLSLAVLVGAAVLGLRKCDPRVAFLGDSITQGWSYPATNFGVHGNTTAQMLDRFPALIPGHGYRTVVVLGGTNDVLLGVPAETTIHNLETIGDAAVEQHAEPILCELPPIFHDYDLNDKRDFSAAVQDRNQRIAALAAEHHWKLVDYYTPLAGHPSWSSDGVHLKLRGYLVMERALFRQLPPL